MATMRCRVRRYYDAWGKRLRFTPRAYGLVDHDCLLLRWQFEWGPLYPVAGWEMRVPGCATPMPVWYADPFSMDRREERLSRSVIRVVRPYSDCAVVALVLVRARKLAPVEVRRIVLLGYPDRSISPQRP